ncbi:hypothetical protein [Melittangium boletus]|uniref:Uncharacterized protein n=1 Tax=Melittangium boletus DSM 14713 TaxID=1294270 RepID=A0A250IG25_9BACT|nr:hypothetical protein [Melittangium boletus]ATB30117.1 hypothetical protein MEBOL_003572 [Melittangium boletus DSM 14713]
MSRPYPALLVVALLMEGGVPSAGDTGVVTAPALNAPLEDAGILVPLPLPSTPPEDAGVAAAPAIVAEGIRWPDDVRPLATLDGPAVLAAHAALQRVLTRVPKAYAGTCAYSAKAMEVIVGQEEGLYFVRINRRVDKCGRMAPGAVTALDWFELYAVSPDGRILARYPYFP